MASASLFFLLLLSTSFLVCSLSVRQPSDRQETRALQKRSLSLTKIADHALTIATILKPFIAMIPEAGTGLSIFIDVASKIQDINEKKKMLHFMKMEFKQLNERIDETRRELKWDIWASATYGKVEGKINVAWNKVVDLLENCDESCFQDLKNSKKGKEIKNDLKDTKDYVYKFHDLIVGDNVYRPKYEKILPDTVRCEYSSIRNFSAVNVGLMFKAVTMAHFFNSLNGQHSDGSLIDKAFDVSKAMYQIQRNCLLNTNEYVEKDVKKFIDTSKKRKDIAREIRKHLDKTYDYFNWMVVVFKTALSGHTSRATKWMNSHTLDGFIEVTKGEFTVAVAKQAKGNHKKTKEVRPAIEKCLEKAVMCYKIPKVLEKCKIKDKFTAIHAYHFKEHANANTLNAKDAPTELDYEPEEPQTTPYTYKGKCTPLPGIKTGHFRVLIKSDEELMNNNPCTDVDCGKKENRGKCVPLGKEYIGLCECEKGYYGQKCEESIEDYKKKMLTKEIPESVMKTLK
ncbi:PREDICTED: uncharacterized protein LOC107080924 [Cyprinodon variegatus]|uniref:Uncharacterized LOC107080924 n=1 Tax=Cyprinodon variegatus TaxID=28743 RepID=A0A3Q2E3B3_CYPVA|nr:PREDICTED: uncharacterized protein LOC107080924 [Cyprinodon variegatus]